MVYDVSIEDITSQVVERDAKGVITSISGSGMFDKLMEAATNHIEKQLTDNRITSENYGTVYLGTMQTVIAESIGFALQRAQLKAKLEIDDNAAFDDLLLKEVQRKVYNNQAALYDRQRAGFDDDAKQKLLKTVLDSWSVAYSTAPDAAAIPDAVTRTNLDAMTKNAMNSLGIDSQYINFTY